ncbi:MAG TPA: DUF2946 family protein, partial [Pseudothauera hydrothermalis]|nr:DUF2946 family protein [Pseudothauera hydrothermalis]
MSFSSRRLRRTAWIALFAMLIGALAPTVSRVLAAGEGSWNAVCSASGVIYLPVDTAPAPDEGGPHLAAACAYCFTSAASFGLAAPQPASIDASQGRPVVSLAVPSGPLV